MLSLPKGIHQRLAEEFRFAADRIAETADINTKMYFFSVFYAEVQRLFNQHWDADLALMQLVLFGASQQILQRPPGLPGGGVNNLPPGFLEALDKVSDELATIFEGLPIDTLKLYAALARVAELGYVSSGNGAYLNLRGQIKL